jgi:hypothetical protein
MIRTDETSRADRPLLFFGRDKRVPPKPNGDKPGPPSGADKVTPAGGLWGRGKAGRTSLLTGDPYQVFHAMSRGSFPPISFPEGLPFLREMPIIILSGASARRSG